MLIKTRNDYLQSPVARVVAAVGAPVSFRTISKGPEERDEWGTWYDGTHYYDGETIAIFRDRYPMSEHDLLHEIGHWFVADDVQRLFPEFGLGNVALPLQAGSEAIVKNEESNLQEFLVQMFCICVGMKFGINVWDDNSTNPVEWKWRLEHSTWDLYAAEKRRECVEFKVGAAWWDEMMEFMKSVVDTF